jgi:hypothetical protein
MIGKGEQQAAPDTNCQLYRAKVIKTVRLDREVGQSLEKRANSELSIRKILDQLKINLIQSAFGSDLTEPAICELPSMTP